MHCVTGVIVTGKPGRPWSSSSSHTLRKPRPPESACSWRCVCATLQASPPELMNGRRGKLLMLPSGQQTARRFKSSQTDGPVRGSDRVSGVPQQHGPFLSTRPAPTLSRRGCAARPFPVHVGHGVRSHAPHPLSPPRSSLAGHTTSHLPPERGGSVMKTFPRGYPRQGSSPSLRVDSVWR